MRSDASLKARWRDNSGFKKPTHRLDFSAFDRRLCFYSLHLLKVYFRPSFCCSVPKYLIHFVLNDYLFNDSYSYTLWNGVKMFRQREKSDETSTIQRTTNNSDRRDTKHLFTWMVPCIVTIVRNPVGLYELKTERQVRDYSNSLIDSEKNIKRLTSRSKKRVK
jgi:hypothetical protein